MWPMTMHPFRRVARHLRRRRSDTLRLESCPLHTERPEWAAKAPAQVAAALKRGADVIALTEVHTTLAHELARLCAQNGYGFFHGQGDVAVAYKMTLGAKASNVAVPGCPTPFVKVEFTFHGSDVTVIALHLFTVRSSHMAIRAAQTHALISEMQAASAGRRLAFFMADDNPTKVQSNPTSEPRATLNAAGLWLVNEELSDWPAGLGVTTIGRAKADTRVTATGLVLSDPLGSDHSPETATFKVRR